jgi:hypothetical protein
MRANTIDAVKLAANVADRVNGIADFKLRHRTRRNFSNRLYLNQGHTSNIAACKILAALSPLTC